MVLWYLDTLETFYRKVWNHVFVSKVHYWWWLRRKHFYSTVLYCLFGPAHCTSFLNALVGGLFKCTVHLAISWLWHKEMERSLGTQFVLLSAHIRSVAASVQMLPVGLSTADSNSHTTRTENCRKKGIWVRSDKTKQN